MLLIDGLRHEGDLAARLLGMAAPGERSPAQLLTLGVPAALEQMLSVGRVHDVAGGGRLDRHPALAAQQIAFTALSTAFLPGIAFSIAATALVGQSIGARLPADARMAWIISLRWAVGWLGIGGVLVFIFAEQMMEIFSADPEVIDAGVGALRALSFSLPVLGDLVRQQRQACAAAATPGRRW